MGIMFCHSEVHMNGPKKVKECLSMKWRTTVSYTHLDVYKRQLNTQYGTYFKTVSEIAHNKSVC